jgi:GTP cyclohydrolase II
VVVAAVEGLTRERLDELRSLREPVRLVVTHHRGRALGVQARETGSDLSFSVGTTETPDSLVGLAADRVPDSPDGSAGELRSATPAEAAGLALARLGHLLPAIVAVEARPGSPLVGEWLEDGSILDVSVKEVETAVAEGGIEITEVAEASVPLALTDSARFVFFRESGGLLEHVAVLIGARDRWPDPVPVRLHSACLTGDLFESRRCDCGEQLRGSLEHFKKIGGGVLVYLAQEGRGIGLGNKIRAYSLQETGLDTVDADGVLGFGADERRYDAAVAILRRLSIGRVELLTNNPEKVHAVEDAGIEVVARTPIFGGLNRHNLRYVKAKVDRSGHWLMDMISQPVSAD